MAMKKEWMTLSEAAEMLLKEGKRACTQIVNHNNFVASLN